MEFHALVDTNQRHSLEKDPFTWQRANAKAEDAGMESEGQASTPATSPPVLPIQHA